MNKNILVIDDDVNLRLLYQKALSAEGYYVAAAGSEEESFELLKKQKFDLIVLDIEMPYVSGLELIQKIKQDWPRIRVILNSAFSIYKSDFKTWLADAYIVKSSNLDPLVSEIKNVIENRNEHQAK